MLAQTDFLHSDHLNHQNIDHEDEMEEIHEDGNTFALLERQTEQLKQVMYETVNTFYREYLRPCQPLTDTRLQLDSLKKRVDNLPENTSRIAPTSLGDEIHSLGLLIKLHERLQEFDNLLDVGELRNAASSIVEMLETLDQLVILVGLTLDKTIFDVVKSEYLAKKARFKHRLDQLFCATITTSKKNHSPELSVSFKILSTHAKKYVENPVALDDVLCCMYMMDMLEPKLRDLAQTLLNDFVEPILADPRIQVVVNKTKLHANLKLSCPPGKRTSTSGTDLEACLKNLVQFAQFLDTCLLPGKILVQGQEFRHVSVLGALWWKDFWAKLYSRLKPLIPEHRDQLTFFHETHGYMLAQLEEALANTGIIPHQPSEISMFVRDVERTFVKKHRNDLLLTARDVLVTDDPNTVEVTHATERGGITSSKEKGAKDGKGSSVGLEVFNLPTMHVSERVRTVVEMAYQTMQEAVKQEGQGAIELYYCVRDLFGLTRAVLPTGHGMELDHAPGPTLVFYNDCIYICHHLLTLAHQFKTQLPSPLSELATFVDMIPSFRKMGETLLKRQLHRQRDLLIASLRQVSGLDNLQDDIKFEQVENAVKDSLFQLTSLAKIWKPLGPQDLYRDMMGTLVDSLLSHVEQALSQLTCLTSQDCYNLRYVLSLLPPQVEKWLEVTRGVGKNKTSEKAPIPKHVKLWDNYQQILQVLSMASEAEFHEAKPSSSLALSLGHLRFTGIKA